MHVYKLYTHVPWIIFHWTECLFFFFLVCKHSIANTEMPHSDPASVRGSLSGFQTAFSCSVTQGSPQLLNQGHVLLGASHCQWMSEMLIGEGKLFSSLLWAISSQWALAIYTMTGLLQQAIIVPAAPWAVWDFCHVCIWTPPAQSYFSLFPPHVLLSNKSFVSNATCFSKNPTCIL